MASRVEHLQGLLERLDVALITCAEREVAAISREKRQVLAELDSLAGLAEGSPIDELKRKRDARKARVAAAAAPPAT